MWPGQLRYQFYNRRHIGNNPLKRWSQHAGSEPAQGWYGNAVDIFDPTDSYDSSLLDEVHAFLQTNRAQFRIRVILWRVASHHDHIHVDTWPKMADEWWRRPPPSGPVLTVEPDGTRHDTYATNQTPKEEDMPFLPLKLGDGMGDREFKRSDVAAIQAMINRAYQAGLETDGIYGDATASAVATHLGGDGDSFYGNLYDDLHAALVQSMIDKADSDTLRRGDVVQLGNPPSG
jgi:hypothetical protein